MSRVIEINSVTEWNTNLRAATAAGQTVVVDAYATWCGPCKAIAPVFDNLAKSADWVKFLRFDVDKLPAIAQKYKVTAMPTFFAIKGGKVIGDLKGADPAGLNRLVYTHAGPNPPVPPLSEEAEKAKESGNAAFKSSDYSTALSHYSHAISLAPTSYLLLGNRSLTYLKLSPPDYSSSLYDAEAALNLAPTWAKGYVRKGEALEGLERFEEAKEAFERAVEKGQGTVKTEATQKLEKLKSRMG
ncbi:uncharacterized protein JCM6883_003413 [Sporobolomyces salmoneus]|uniref:uncharacterized protein n=1 Tax=Sporobolomyces salmoneus TaxID=183962 RepID=UPI003172EE8B